MRSLLLLALMMLGFVFAEDVENEIEYADNGDLEYELEDEEDDDEDDDELEEDDEEDGDDDEEDDGDEEEEDDGDEEEDDDDEYELEDDDDDDDRHHRRYRRHRKWFRRFWLRRHWYRLWKKHMYRLYLRRQRKARRLRRLQQERRRRYRHYLKMRRLRRRMMKKLHLKGNTKYNRSLLSARKQLHRTRQMYKLVRSQIVHKIYEIRTAQDINVKNRLVGELQGMIAQAKALRRTMMRKAMGQYRNMKRLAYGRKVKGEVKRMIKERRMLRRQRKIENAYLSVNNKINVLKHDFMYKPKGFVKACKKAIKYSCLKFRVNKKDCKIVYSKVQKRVNKLRKVIQKKKAQRDALLRKNLKQRINQRLVQKTVKGVAKKFEKNYRVMNKYRNTLDLTCKMDRRSCNFFRRSFGEKVPMF